MSIDGLNVMDDEVEEDGPGGDGLNSMDDEDELFRQNSICRSFVFPRR